MFRRRTDKVYATLQEVQRRITQGTEADDDHALLRPPGQQVSRVHTQAPPQRPAPASSSWSSGPSSFMPGPRSESLPQRHRTQYDANPGQLILPPGMTPLPVPDPGTVTTAGAQYDDDKVVAQQYPATDGPEGDMVSDPGYQRLARRQGQAPAQPGAGDRLPQGGVFISAPVLMMLAVLWLASIGVAVALTDAARRGATPAEDLTEVPSGDGMQDRHDAAVIVDSGRREPRTNERAIRQPLGDYYIIIQSVSRYSAEAEERFRNLQASHNQQAENSGRLAPWFGIRRPASGGLQYIYGEVAEGVIGIPRNDQTEGYLDLIRRTHDDARFLPLP